MTRPTMTARCDKALWPLARALVKRLHDPAFAEAAARLLMAADQAKPGADALLSKMERLQDAA